MSSPALARRLALPIALLLAGLTRAAEPIIQTKFTADPAPLVHDGVVYLYTSHDEDDAPAGQGRFLMRDWLCYSSTDMVNWTDHGAVASLATFPWAVQENDAWAPQVVARHGKFYLYAPVSVPGWPKNVIAVAVADSPLGPFKDPLGHPLIDKELGYIDPTVLIDDDGQAYLYWGNPNLWHVKLNDDMISTAGDIVQDDSKPENYQEGPWVYHHADHYYLAYASTCCPEGIGYAMSDSPTGPWSYAGYIVPPDKRSTGNHPGIIDYQGKSYVFGFNFKLNFAITEKHHERRSVCVAELHYRPDGTISELPWWEENRPVEQLAPLDPYVRTEAETIAWSEGIHSEPAAPGGMAVYPVHPDAFIKVQGVDFGAGAHALTAAVACADDGASIELHLGSPTGRLIATSEVNATGGPDRWHTLSTTVEGARDVQDLYLVFRGPTAPSLRLDWWKFE